MSRVTKMLKALQKETKAGSQNVLQSQDSLDVSSIEKDSYLQGDLYSPHGNPLHSTALEDETSPQTDQPPKPTAGKGTGEKRVNKAQNVTPKKSTQAGKNGKNKTQEKADVQLQQKNTKSKENRRPVEQKDQGPKSRNLQTISETREEDGKRRTQSKGPISEALADDSTPHKAYSQRQQHPSLSSEELTDEDESFSPSKSKPKVLHVKLQRPSSQQKRRQKQKRKSSSGSSDHGNPTKKPKPGGSLIDLDVVLEAFQEFVTEYKKTVNSESVKKAIDALSNSFEEQLTELITATKELNSVKRKAVKINGTLNQKKTRLLEAKNELIRSEAEMRKLEKDHNELEQRLKALKQGTTFLTNLKQLNKKYLQHRTAHPHEQETYGPSCLPAMLLEARSITGTESQLKMINDELSASSGVN
ncbi:centromere protein U [Trichomycterus rosablanca]|uniref:centromere protein U n=1 Tax=Trichomycterus rosablanca TaxID=2290929 RepID=UPI002F351708